MRKMTEKEFKSKLKELSSDLDSDVRSVLEVYNKHRKKFTKLSEKHQCVHELNFYLTCLDDTRNYVDQFMSNHYGRKIKEKRHRYSNGQRLNK